MISKPKPEAEDWWPLPFPGRNGRGVRVAVIDSGVNPRHPHIAQVAGGVSIREESEEDGVFLDTLGHGTAVMAAIQEKAPEAEFFAVRIFESALRAKTSSLLHAIRWAVRNGMHLVNLSLGTTNPKHLEAFREVVDIATEHGVTLIAARDADGKPCLPGSLPDVLSVAVDLSLHRHAFRAEQTEGGPVFHASGFPRPIPGMPVAHNLHGISFAVANLTGLAARAADASGTPGPHGIRETLLSSAERP